MNWLLLKNSLLVSGLATVLALAGGSLVALCLLTTGPAWRNRVLALAAVALALPPFLVTNCWLWYLGQTGIWRTWLPWNIYSLSGTIWILALLSWPIAVFSVYASWQKLEPTLLEQDPALTGWALVRHLLFPMAKPALAQAAVLIFVLALNNFAVPAILQVRVYPAELWVSFNTTFDYRAALGLSWPLVVVPVLALLWLSRREIAWPRLEGEVPARFFAQQLGPFWTGLSRFTTLAIIAFAVALPARQLFGNPAMWRDLPVVFATGQAPLIHSLGYAASAATLTVGLGLLTWRWRLGLVGWLPLLIPGVVLGIALVWLLNRPSLALIYQSAGVVILAWLLRYFPVGWTGASQARRSIDPELADAGRLDGAAGWMLFRHILWPQMAAPMAAAWYITYLLCLWDVETLILVVPPGGETLALRIFNLLHYGHNGQVDALCAWLLILAVLPLAAAWGWKRLHTSSLRGWAGRAARPALTFLALLVLSACTPPSSLTEAPLESKIFSRVQIIGSRGTGLGQFNKPRSVALDQQDNLYVVDMTGRVQKFSPQGVFQSFWQMEDSPKGKPKGMATDNGGNILVVEPHFSRVNCFSGAGILLSQWGRNGTNAGELAFPRAVAVNSHDEIYVSEYNLAERVQRFAGREHRFVNAFGRGGAGSGEFDRAEGLGVDPQDRVYVADSCNHRIQVFSREGKFLRAYGHPGRAPGQFSYPYDVRVDAAGRQYVCEFGNSRIQVLDANDQPLETLGQAGSDPGQFNSPWSIALDSAGNLYVADSANHRVQKLIARHSPSSHLKPVG